MRFVAGLTPILLVVAIFVLHTPGAQHPLLNQLVPLIDSLTRLGELLTGGVIPRVAPIVTVTLFVVALTLLAQESAARSECLLFAAAIAGASLTYGTLLSGRSVIATIAAFATILVYKRCARITFEKSPAPPRHGEALGLCAAITVFAVLGAYHIDVHPPTYSDETYYHAAARMTAGLEPVRDPFPEIYSYQRFVAQFVPLGIQTIAAWFLGGDLLSIRLSSLCVGALALVIFYVTLRPRLGVPVYYAVWMASAGPLMIAYSRTGLYLVSSILLGTVALTTTLRLVERETAGRAFALGFVYAISMFAYQISWFAPVLSGLCLAACWGIRPTVAQRRLILVTLVSAVSLVSMVAPNMSAGIRNVLSQSFDDRSPVVKAIFRPTHLPAEAESVERLGGKLWIPPGRAIPSEIAVAAAEENPDFRIRVIPAVDNSHFIVFRGNPETFEKYREVIAPLAETTTSGSSRQFYLAPLEQVSLLIRDPSFDSLTRVISAPILNPILVPLLLLGLVDLIRNRQNPRSRIILVWCSSAVILVPMLGGGDMARRALLLFPPLFIVAALPAWRLLRLANLPTTSGLPRLTSERKTRIVNAMLLLGVIAMIATGSSTYFYHWNITAAYGPVDAKTGEPLDNLPRIHEPKADKLWLGLTLARLPDDERAYFVIPQRFRLRWTNSVRVRPGLTNVTVFPALDRPSQIVQRACNLRFPQNWVAESTPASEDLFSSFRESFIYERRTDGAFVIYRATGRLPHACKPPAPPPEDT